MIRKKISAQRNLLKAYNMMLYFAGTMIMWEPENECIQDFWNTEILKSLPVRSSNPRFVKAASQLRESVHDKKSSFEHMKSDYAFLFRGTDPAAPVIESEFSVKYPEVTPGRRIPASQLYRAYGWKPVFSIPVPDDHLGTQLLFLTVLVEKYLETDDRACHEEMMSEIRRFIDDHLLNWVPGWEEIVEDKAFTMSYKGIANLILSSIEDLYGIMQAVPVADSAK